jgi:uncharacterized protein (DUF697 family)/ribosomal protein S27AE
MALKGLDYFKYTPKTNCKACGKSTCMAFSMDVAAGRIEIGKCPHIKSEDIAKLGGTPASPTETAQTGVPENNGGSVPIMDRKEELLEIIQQAKSEVFPGYEMYSYKDFSEKKRNGLRTFDPHLVYGDFVAIYDTTLFKSAKDGLMFTVYGFYFDYAFEKKYVKYSDIVKLSVKPHKNGKPTDAEMEMEVTGAGYMQMSSIYFNKYALKTLLEKLQAVSAKWQDDDHASKSSGKVDKKSNLTGDQKTKCNAIIHSAAVATGAMGVIPIGPADTLMITPAQIAMIISLGAVFNIRVSENLAKSILGGLALSMAGRAVASTVLNFIPVVGWAVKGGTAAALTEAIGWTAVAHFNDIEKNHSRFAGKKEGYAEASAEYEAKLRRQAEDFLKQTVIHKSEMAELSQLVDELTKKIIELSAGKDADNPDVQERIRVLEDLIEKLKKKNKEK